MPEFEFEQAKKRRKQPSRKAKKPRSGSRRSKRSKSGRRHRQGFAQASTNPYMAFCAKNRAAVKAAHPTWGVPEIGKELGRLYRQQKQ